MTELTGAMKLSLALAGAELIILGWMWRVTAPDFAQMYVDFAAGLPWQTRVVLESWWFPALMALLIGMCVHALLVVKRVQRRETMLALTVFAGFVLAATSAAALYLPIFNLAGNIKPG